MDYRFINKDPIIDVIRTAMQRKGNLGPEQIRRTAHGAGVHPGTIDNWLNGDTRRPMNLTTRFVLEALGVSIRYVDDSGIAIKQPKPELISLAAQREILAKDREREKAREAKKQDTKK